MQFVLLYVLALIKVCAKFRQVRVCSRLNLDVSFDTYGAHTNDPVEPRTFLGLSFNGEYILVSTGCPIFTDQPILGLVRMSPTKHAP